MLFFNAFIVTMGRNESEWEYLAKKVTEAGADIVELNFSCPNMEEKKVGVDIGQAPELVTRFTAAPFFIFSKSIFFAFCKKYNKPALFNSKACCID